MPLHGDVQAFANVLHEIEVVLRQHNEKHWAAQITRCLTNVERSDANGVSVFLSFFGGMGSLNDVLLVRDGKALTRETDRLRALVSQASEAGRRLLRDD
jgi:hypothetical protein